MNRMRTKEITATLSKSGASWKASRHAGGILLTAFGETPKQARKALEFMLGQRTNNPHRKPIQEPE